MGEVIQPDWTTRLAIPAERVLDEAMGARLTDVVILGYDANGDEYFATSMDDNSGILWLLERLKFQILGAGGE